MFNHFSRSLLPQWAASGRACPYPQMALARPAPEPRQSAGMGFGTSRDHSWVGPAMLTIHWIPNLSVNWPNSSPHTCRSSGMVTLAPSVSWSQ